MTPLSAQRKEKKSKELPNQELEVPKDPSSFVKVETSRLAFLYSPLTDKGLLSQQTRDAIRALRKNLKGGQIVRLRAFVAGTGDMRRVPAIVSDELGGRGPMPALSVVQVGALPAEGAQVLLEATIVEKKAGSQTGLAFLSGQQVLKEGAVENPLEPVLPLVEKSLNRLQQAAIAAKVAPESMLRVTCLVSSLADYAEVSRKVAQTFPGSANAVVQLQRGPLRPVAECEGVGRTSAASSEKVQLLNPQGLASSPNYSQVVLVQSPSIVLTSSQLAFGTNGNHAKLAFDRLKQVLEQAGSSFQKVFYTSFYPLTNPAAEQIREQRFDYLDRSRPPASTLILFEGLPSHDATFAFDVIAAVN